MDNSTDLPSVSSRGRKTSSRGRKTRRTTSENQVNNLPVEPLNFEGGRFRNSKVEVVMSIPESPPSMADVNARAMSMGVEDILSSTAYTKSVKLYINNQSDWNILCDLSDFMRDNIDWVVTGEHDQIAFKIYSEHQELYNWLYRLSKSEINSPKDSAVSYAALSADWCAVNFRENQCSDLPDNYFHWRNLKAPEDMQGHSEGTALNSRKRALLQSEETTRIKKERYEQKDVAQAMLKSMRLDKAAEVVLATAKEIGESIPDNTREEFGEFSLMLKQLIDQYQDRYEKNRTTNKPQQ